MSDTDLVFELGPNTTGDLLFGETDVTGDVLAQIAGSFQPLSVAILIGQTRYVTVAGSFAPLAASIQLTGLTPATVVGSFAPLSVTVDAVYSSNTARPTVGQTTTPWQSAAPYETGVGVGHQDPTPAPVGWVAFWQRALGVQGVITHPLPHVLEPLPVRLLSVFESGTQVSDLTEFSHQEATRSPLALNGLFQNATPVRRSTLFRHQDGNRVKRASRTTRYQEARALRVRRAGAMQSAVPFLFFRDSRFQDGIPPPAGISLIAPPVVPPPNTCYTPNKNLVFSDLWTGFGDLIFICDNYAPTPPGETVVVPVKRVYIVLNSVSLYRVSDDEPVPVFSMSLSLDVDSWTWSFNAALPSGALALVKPTGSTITELKVFVNGTEFRVLAESVSRSRAFGQTSINVSGRGYNASLDAPYAPTQSFTNTQERTAQQLMADVLTLNNVPLDWTINWELEDWLVPAGVFNHQGTYISALNSIAGAAGGFLLPHPSTKSFTVKHRYPVKPWEWATATPDFSLPANVVTQEGIEWVDKAPYNRVYVSGQSVGVLGRITRQGTAGDVLAQLVTDPLITEGAAARQRGTAILSDVGMQAHVTLRLPVLAETGVLRPGHMIDYVDGLITRRGIVRSTQVAMQGVTNVWQSVGVETHDV